MTYNTAVRVVDGDEAQEPTVRSEEILQAREAALKAEEPVLENLEREIADVGAERVWTRAQAHKDALIVVARAMARGGQDPTAYTEAIASVTESIFALLMSVQDATAAPVDPAFGHHSSAAQMAKATAVGRILGGGEP